MASSSVLSLVNKDCILAGAVTGFRARIGRFRSRVCGFGWTKIARRAREIGEADVDADAAFDSSSLISSSSSSLLLLLLLVPCRSPPSVKSSSWVKKVGESSMISVHRNPIIVAESFSLELDDRSAPVGVDVILTASEGIISRATWKSLSMMARSGERGRGEDVEENEDKDEDEVDSVILWTVRVARIMEVRILIAIMDSHVQVQRSIGRVSTGGIPRRMKASPLPYNPSITISIERHLTSSTCIRLQGQSYVRRLHKAHGVDPRSSG